ncbi:MAG: circadian oscillation regulator KaiB [Phycisphaerales bacterium]|nr:circadian oscillation regulator KaiB [Phycisphaerales bacterium]
MERYVLRLFVAGQTQSSLQARHNLDRICADHLKGKCDITVTDIFEDSDLAEAPKVLATPTLIKEWPAPLRRIIGDLSDTQKVLAALSLIPPAPAT